MEEIRIIAELKVKPEFRAELMPILEKLVKGSRAEAGNRQYDLVESEDNPCHFFAIESWDSQEAIAGHNATPHFQAFLAAAKDKIEGININKGKVMF